MTEAIGWAVVDNGDIKVNTVSDTRRASIINWLVTERGCRIYNQMTDEQIERLWFQYRPDEVDVSYVSIIPTLPPAL